MNQNRYLTPWKRNDLKQDANGNVTKILLLRLYGQVLKIKLQSSAREYKFKRVVAGLIFYWLAKEVLYTKC